MPDLGDLVSMGYSPEQAAALMAAARTQLRARLPNPAAGVPAATQGAAVPADVQPAPPAVPDMQPAAPAQGEGESWAPNEVQPQTRPTRAWPVAAMMPQERQRIADNAFGSLAPFEGTARDATVRAQLGDTSPDSAYGKFVTTMMGTRGLGDRSALSFGDLLPLAPLLHAQEAKEAGDEGAAWRDVGMGASMAAAPILSKAISVAPKLTAGIAGTLGLSMSPSEAQAPGADPYHDQEQADKDAVFKALGPPPREPTAPDNSTLTDAGQRASARRSFAQEQAAYPAKKAAYDALAARANDQIGQISDKYNTKRDADAQAERDRQKALDQAPAVERMPWLAYAMPPLSMAAAMGPSYAAQRFVGGRAAQHIGEWQDTLDKAERVLARAPTEKVSNAQLRDQAYPLVQRAKGMAEDAPSPHLPGWARVGLAGEGLAASYLPQEMDLFQPNDTRAHKEAVENLTTPAGLTSGLMRLGLSTAASRSGIALAERGLPVAPIGRTEALQEAYRQRFPTRRGTRASQ